MRRTGPSALQHPHGRHNERPRRVGRVIEDHRSHSGRITPDIRVIIADFFGQICGDDHLYITRSVATEDSACDRRASLARWRVPPVASGQPCRSARRSCRGQAGAPPAAWHALGAAAAHPQRRQVAPRRAVSASCHRAGAPGAPVLRHRRSPPAGRTAARRKQSWPDPLRRRQESPAKGTTQPHQCKGQRGGKGTFFLVRAFWVRLGIRLQQVMPASPPCAGTRSQPADRHIVPLRCCILLLYKARERWAQDFEFIYLTWVELRGFEPRTSCMPCKRSTN